MPFHQADLTVDFRVCNCNMGNKLHTRWYIWAGRGVRIPTKVRDVGATECRIVDSLPQFLLLLFQWASILLSAYGESWITDKDSYYVTESRRIIKSTINADGTPFAYYAAINLALYSPSLQLVWHPPDMRGAFKLVDFLFMCASHPFESDVVHLSCHATLGKDSRSWWALQGHVNSLGTLEPQAQVTWSIRPLEDLPLELFSGDSKVRLPLITG